jgi:hypothetical protein
VSALNTNLVTRRTVFSRAKIGQSVAGEDQNRLYEGSRTDKAGPMTHKVVEIGDDCLAMRDAAGTAESRILVTMVRADDT